MECTFGQYLRIENKAGGVNASLRQFVKATHTLLSEKGKSPEARQARHQFIRSVIERNRKAKNLCK